MKALNQILSDNMEACPMNDIRKVYKRLKGLRSEKAKELKRLAQAARRGHSRIFEEKEDGLITLIRDKTQMRKKFEELTQRRGPYRRT